MKKSPLEYILLELLKGKFVSGEEIAKSLNISRTWVWNQINILKQLGFKIESCAKKGYRLSSVPDVLLPPLIKTYLDTNFIGKKIYFFEELDSTQNKAKELAEQGEEEGTLIICEEQNVGRGRRGRKWVHVPKKSLAFSLILRPKLSPLEIMQLPLVTGVAICEVLNRHTNVKTYLKWPNDVIMGGKKVAGILAEMSGDTESVNYVVLGVGVNINLTKQDIPPVLQDIATSIFIENKEKKDRIKILTEILKNMEYWYNIYITEGFSKIRRRWIKLNNTLDKHVSVFFRDKTIDGKAIDIDNMGNLLVIDKLNNIHKIMYGDVSIRTK